MVQESSFVALPACFCAGRRCVTVFTKTHCYYEPAESGPHFLSRLSTILLIVALFMLSADTAVSKMNGNVLKSFDSRKGKYFPAVSKFIVSRPVPVPTKPPVQRMWRFFTFGGRSGAEVKYVWYFAPVRVEAFVKWFMCTQFTFPPLCTRFGFTNQNSLSCACSCYLPILPFFTSSF